MNPHLFIVLAALITSHGCSRQHAGTITAHDDAPSPAPAPTGSLEPGRELTEAEVVEIAKRTIGEREEWTRGAVYHEPRRAASGDWTVLVQRVHGHDEHGKPTFVPDGDRLIVIDGAGHVIRYGR